MIKQKSSMIWLASAISDRVQASDCASPETRKTFTGVSQRHRDSHTTTRRGLLWGLLSCAAVTHLKASPQERSPQSGFPADEEVEKLIADHIGGPSQGFGLVIGMIDERGRRTVAYGNYSRDDNRPLDADTVFEVGSITKVFTSLLLIDMVQKGEVSVTDSVARYLPAGVTAPERSGRGITIEDLALHQSSLPVEPTNMPDRSGAYTEQQLYDFLNNYRLPWDIGSHFEYSNVGVGLLGHLLSLRAGRDYETLVKARVLEPLGMHDTAISLSPKMKLHLATGHDANLRPVGKMDFSIRAPLAPAGGLSSTANDLLTFLAANLGFVKSDLAPAISAQQHSVRRRLGPSMPDEDVAYGLFVQKRINRSIIWHNGSSPGFRSYLGFDPVSRTGVIVLSNRFSPSLPDDLGRHLLDPTYPIA